MRGNITVSIIECLQIFIELVRQHQAVADDFASTRNTNKLFWFTVTLIVQRLTIDIKPQSKEPFMLM